MDIDERLEIGFGIELKAGLSPKKVFASALRNLLDTDMSNVELDILTSVLNNAKKEIKHQYKSL